MVGRNRTRFQAMTGVVKSMDQTKTPTGALWALLAALIFSINDMLVKFLSDGYALHQIVFTRSLISVLLLVLVVIPLAGGDRKSVV